jgi:diacylglycerol kinase family enzyme
LRGGAEIKHFFVINPLAHKIKGRVGAISESIHAFFKEHPDMRYDIHVTRWERDALGVIRRYATGAEELLRIHVMGGSDSLFEAVNGIVGLPNAHLAVYPYGSENSFLRYFGNDKLHLFTSIRSQVFSDTITVDALRCGHHHGIAYGLVGLEAAANKDRQKTLDQKTIFPDDFIYIWSGAKKAFSNWIAGQEYQIRLDDETLDGVYLSMLIANSPAYGKNLAPAADAHPNDGFLDIYLMNKMSRFKFLTTSRNYLSGRYQKLDGVVSHYRCKKISIASETPMCFSVDGQVFFEHSIEYEALPYAIDFVCPGGIDVDKLPRIYGRPDAVVREGLH